MPLLGAVALVDLRRLYACREATANARIMPSTTQALEQTSTAAPGARTGDDSFALRPEHTLALLSLWKPGALFLALSTCWLTAAYTPERAHRGSRRSRSLRTNSERNRVVERHRRRARFVPREREPNGSGRNAPVAPVGGRLRRRPAVADIMGARRLWTRQ